MKTRARLPCPACGKNVARMGDHRLHRHKDPDSGDWCNETDQEWARSPIGVCKACGKAGHVQCIDHEFILYGTEYYRRIIRRWGRSIYFCRDCFYRARDRLYATEDERDRIRKMLDRIEDHQDSIRYEAWERMKDSHMEMLNETREAIRRFRACRKDLEALRSAQKEFEQRVTSRRSSLRSWLMSLKRELTTKQQRRRSVLPKLSSSLRRSNFGMDYAEAD